MDVERELNESLDIVVDLEKELAMRGDTLAEQAIFLERDLERRDENDLTALAKFCLLSEIWGAIDFDRMVEVRERFQAAFPEHFPYYLSNLDNISWQITWPGCMECANFEGECSVGLVPVESESSRGRYDRECLSKTPRQKPAAA
ncbi:MAG: hypothetical protein ACYC1U_09400 [Candidatus Aquicultorales bacterium]